MSFHVFCRRWNMASDFTSQMFLTWVTDWKMVWSSAEFCLDTLKMKTQKCFSPAMIHFGIKRAFMSRASCNNATDWSSTIRPTFYLTVSSDWKVRVLKIYLSLRLRLIAKGICFQPPLGIVWTVRFLRGRRDRLTAETVSHLRIGRSRFQIV